MNTTKRSVFSPGENLGLEADTHLWRLLLTDPLKRKKIENESFFPTNVLKWNLCRFFFHLTPSKTSLSPRKLKSSDFSLIDRWEKLRFAWCNLWKSKKTSLCLWIILTSVTEVSSCREFRPVMLRSSQISTLKCDYFSERKASGSILTTASKTKRTLSLCVCLQHITSWATNYS